MKRDSNGSKKFGETEPKAYEAEVGCSAKGIEFRFIRDMLFQHGWVHCIVQHYEVTPFRSQEYIIYRGHLLNFESLSAQLIINPTA
jgi:hypothetical protein